MAQSLSILAALIKNSKFGHTGQLTTACNSSYRNPAALLTENTYIHAQGHTDTHSHIVKNKSLSQAWWRMPLIPALRWQTQADLCEFKASLVYKTSSRTTRVVTQRNPVFENKTKQNKQTNKKTKNPIKKQTR